MDRWAGAVPAAVGCAWAPPCEVEPLLHRHGGFRTWAGCGCSRAWLGKGRPLEPAELALTGRWKGRWVRCRSQPATLMCGSASWVDKPGRELSRLRALTCDLCQNLYRRLRRAHKLTAARPSGACETQLCREAEKTPRFVYLNGEQA